MAEPHRAQLRICHQRIGDAKPGGAWAWCDLEAAAWCYDDDYYVCDVHLAARHKDHATWLVADERRGKGFGE